MSPIHLIVAADLDNGIGINGDLPWRLKGDLTYFRDITVGKGNNLVVMGRKTWDSIPEKFRPLANRKNLVLSRSEQSLPDDVDQLYALDDLQAYISKNSFDDVFIIGGGTIYDAALDSLPVDSIYLTQVYSSVGCDCFFPKLGPEWSCCYASNIWVEEYTYQFKQYKKV